MALAVIMRRAFLSEWPRTRVVRLQTGRSGTDDPARSVSPVMRIAHKPRATRTIGWQQAVHLVDHRWASPLHHIIRFLPISPVIAPTWTNRTTVWLTNATLDSEPTQAAAWVGAVGIRIVKLVSVPVSWPITTIVVVRMIIILRPDRSGSSDNRRTDGSDNHRNFCHRFRGPVGVSPSFMASFGRSVAIQLWLPSKVLYGQPGKIQSKPTTQVHSLNLKKRLLDLRAAIFAGPTIAISPSTAV